MSEPVQIAVVGCGHWGKNLVRNFRKLGVWRSFWKGTWRKTVYRLENRDTSRRPKARCVARSGESWQVVHNGGG